MEKVSDSIPRFAYRSRFQSHHEVVCFNDESNRLVNFPINGATPRDERVVHRVQSRFVVDADYPTPFVTTNDVG